ncbi:HNH endonuclease signature motif containing protein [Gulosibacter macacae]|uniref:HNH endonuclease signature motif containing protein n=1 Tax=Gulosibacter macacae TaxID=2488791 RepID=UPI001F36C27B|nr:HNH endonuclease signature motif containing protein [Gulosibacter macacae]
MTTATDQQGRFLSDRIRDYDDAWQAGAPLGLSGELVGDAALLTDAQLVDVLHAAGVLRRQVDGVIAALAGEIASRVTVQESHPIARERGHRSTCELVEYEIGVPRGEARRFIEVGANCAGETWLSGERAPANTPHVAEAIGEGRIGLAAAAEIVEFNDRVSRVVPIDDVQVAEAVLVDLAAEVTLRELKKAIQHSEALIDPDGLEPKIERQRQARALRFGTDAQGMVTLSGKLDPETAAPIRAVIDALVTHQLRSARGSNVTLATYPPHRGRHRQEDKAAVSRADAVAGLAGNCASALGESPEGIADEIGSHDLERPSWAFGPPEHARHTEPTVRIEHAEHPDAPTTSSSWVSESRSAQSSLVDGVVSAPSAAGVRFVPTESLNEAGSSSGTAGVEHRSIPQLQADALATLCRHALGCDAAELAGTSSTTVVVRMPLEAVIDSTSTTDGTAVGPSHCEIDGHGPIDVSTARKMAASAGIIPLVLGGDSEVLNLGRSRRFFTPAQRLALVERDGGCAFCGLPPGMAEAHHIKWWTRDHGPTDLSNGILLCTTCHHRIHHDWDVHIVPDPEREGSGNGSGGTVWFVPNGMVDSRQTPRLGGRKRFDPAFRQAHPPTPLPPTPKIPPRVVQTRASATPPPSEGPWGSAHHPARDGVAPATVPAPALAPATAPAPFVASSAAAHERARSTTSRHTTSRHTTMRTLEWTKSREPTRSPRLVSSILSPDELAEERARQVLASQFSVIRSRYPRLPRGLRLMRLTTARTTTPLPVRRLRRAARFSDRQ